MYVQPLHEWRNLQGRLSSILLIAMNFIAIAGIHSVNTYEMKLCSIRRDHTIQLLLSSIVKDFATFAIRNCYPL